MSVFRPRFDERGHATAEYATCLLCVVVFVLAIQIPGWSGIWMQWWRTEVLEPLFTYFSHLNPVRDGFRGGLRW